MKNIKILLYIEKYINGILKMPLMFLEIYFMKIVKRISCIFLMMLFIFCFEYTVSQAINFVNTDYIHEFKQDINNLLDDNIDTYFTLPDFTNYLEFKLENHSGVSGIELVFDDTEFDYKYKIYSSNDGYTYNEVALDRKL